ncbi:DUF6528 family protein [Chitinophaga qingshengii]|uniref:PQQ-binding-like beta-propeller repeat protein n=1 Tax=Chitinophaga qingshengii TaxID=1569794 RepID=A0ABR7TJQ5_9BACT|nr:DUF6528 family protein [Chitinophaga qingshengii]MBC9929727.1 hypothetical protein [Chitinophaga qingshengii]
MNKFIAVVLILFFGGKMCIASPDTAVNNCQRCIVLAEQAEHRVVIADVSSGKIIWEWKPALCGVQPEHVKWFNNPSEVKAVNNGKYILTTASGGGVALIRIADKKTVFYGYAGGNTHSAAILPDGNIVSASSTGNYLMVFKTDTTGYNANGYTKKIQVAFGHNVVWDAARQRLWTAAMDSMIAYRYNNDRQAPDLLRDTSMLLPGTEAHDLYPVYGENSLWLTNTTHVYRFDVNTRKLSPAPTIQANIKSVSSGPAGFPVIVCKPKVSWWTDEVLDAQGKRVFMQAGLKIYKARWVLPDLFSEPVR